MSHLKIARDYIARATERPEVAATIRAMIHLARELGVGVIAEGVETEQQRNLLVSAGVATQAQGYLFSGAVDADQAGDMLRAGAVRPLNSDEAEAAVASSLFSGKYL